MTNSSQSGSQSIAKLIELARRHFSNGEHRQCHERCLEVLNQDPENIDAYQVFALNTYATRNWGASKQAFEFLLSKRPNNITYYGYLAHINVEVGNSDKVDVCLDILAKHYTENSRTHGLYTRALYAKANEHVYLGQLEAAGKTLRTLIGVAKANGQAFWLLSRLYTAKNSELLDEILASLPTSPSSTNSLYLHYAAAKELDDLGRYAEAFSNLEAGSVIKRQQFDYSDTVDAEVFEVLAQTAEFVADKQNAPDQTIRPTFIIGLPRSGSTLVERIVSAHSQMSSAGELTHIRDIIGSKSGYVGVQLDPSGLLREMATLDPAAISKAYTDRVRASFPDATSIIDKFPENYFFVPLLAKAFPNAKFIHVERHDLDCCFSVYRQLFGRTAYYSYDQTELANRYNRYHDLMTLWTEQFPEKVITVQYESLVSNPDVEARKLIEKLGLEWEDGCLNFQTRKERFTTASSVQVRQNIHTRNIGHSRHYLNEFSAAAEILGRKPD